MLRSAEGKPSSPRFLDSCTRLVRAGDGEAALGLRGCGGGGVASPSSGLVEDAPSAREGSGRGRDLAVVSRPRSQEAKVSGRPCPRSEGRWSHRRRPAARRRRPRDAGRSGLGARPSVELSGQLLEARVALPLGGIVGVALHLEAGCSRPRTRGYGLCTAPYGPRWRYAREPAGVKE